VEDDSDDVFAMKMACQRSGISHHLLVAENGDAAVEYLSGEGKYKDRTIGKGGEGEQTAKPAGEDARATPCHRPRLPPEQFMAEVCQNR
jgi:hypothetical protein